MLQSVRLVSRVHYLKINSTSRWKKHKLYHLILIIKNTDITASSVFSFKSYSQLHITNYIKHERPCLTTFQKHRVQSRKYSMTRSGVHVPQGGQTLSECLIYLLHRNQNQGEIARVYLDRDQISKHCHGHDFKTEKD